MIKYRHFLGAFRCILSKDIMRDPVMVPESGWSYERSFIEDWLDRCLYMLLT